MIIQIIIQIYSFEFRILNKINKLVSLIHGVITL